jgi:ribosomal protein L30E
MYYYKGSNTEVGIYVKRKFMLNSDSVGDYVS